MIFLMATSNSEFFPLRASHVGDSGIIVAMATKVTRDIPAMAIMFHRQRGCRAPSNAMAEPPRAYMSAKAAAASPCMLTFVSSRMYTCEMRLL